MAKTFDFNTLKKEYLTVRLKDDKKTVLMIGSPTKAILEEFTEINNRITYDDGADKEAIEDLYKICAKVMSFNKGGIKVTVNQLANYDLEDIMAFFNVYSEYMESVTSAKN